MIIFTISNNHYFFSAIHPLYCFNCNCHWLTLVIRVLCLGAIVMGYYQLLIWVQSLLLKGFTLYCVILNYGYLCHSVDCVHRLDCLDRVHLYWLFNPFFANQHAKYEQNCK